MLLRLSRYGDPSSTLSDALNILHLLVYAKDVASDSKNQYVAPFQNWYHHYKHGGAFIRPDVWKSKYGKRSTIDIQSTVVVHSGIFGAGTTSAGMSAGWSFIHISGSHLSKGDDDLSVVN
jgi:hypothetical protein